MKWLGGLVEQAGVNVFTQFAGAQLIFEGDAVAGVITGDKGRDKDGKPKDNFTPGYELRAKVTVLAEGPRGSLTKKLVAQKKLDGLNPQIYSIGVKELWEVPPGRVARAGSRIRWAGRWIPACTAAAGSTACAKIAFRSGLVAGLEYHNP